MATPKEYAYYTKGNNLFLVQKDTGFINDPNSRDYGAEVNWKSPLSSVVNGVELVYTYSPWYQTSAIANSAVNYWGVDDSDNTVRFADLVVADENFPTHFHDFANDLSVGDYFELRKAGRFSGIHRVKSFDEVVATNGSNVIKTYTQSLSTHSPSDLPLLWTEFEQSVEFRVATNIMKDESYDVPISDYLCKAIVYYLKAKQLEDMLEIEASEYFMAKFRKQVEKNASNKATGLRKMAGFWGMR